MKINLSPQRRDDALNVSRTGDILTINGGGYDFSQLPEGATLSAAAVDCEFIVGDISRTNGELELTLLLPHGPNPTQEQAFPHPVEVLTDGPIALPQNQEVAE
ncbi:hypothetical protein MJO47_09410 [Desulfuromonas sp. KJ2020]|uniref:hypothetical protein n=1 Tax=Desulfuromonas sp. KJ2020 TaxID=2919173 RepID=UPI0020A721FF|nr:hypothetical protein [Desulfuromonas sp. KJ2020]MCP3177315.1 hypothetical protein [Desulfuromonas sp. KJ2020]